MGDLHVFPDKSFQDSQITKVRLITDCFVLNEPEDEEPNKFDVDYNLHVCDLLSSKLSEFLESEMNVEITSTAVTAGLQAGRFKHIGSTNLEEGNVNLPVYLDDEDALAFTEQTLLSSVSEKLSVIIRSWEQREYYVNSLKGVKYSSIKELNLSPEEAILFVQVNGVKIDADAAAKEAALTMLLSMGTMISIKFSAISGQAILLNSDGKPIWADALFRSKLQSECEINNLSAGFMQYFPVSNAESVTVRQEPEYCVSKKIKRGPR